MSGEYKVSCGAHIEFSGKIIAISTSEYIASEIANKLNHYDKLREALEAAQSHVEKIDHSGHALAYVQICEKIKQALADSERGEVNLWKENLFA